MESCSPALRRLLFLLLLAPVLPSCATIVSDARTLLHIDSIERAASVRVLDHEDRAIFEGVTPCEVLVDNSVGYWQGARYTVEVEKAGFLPRRIELESDIDPAFFGNVFLPGGLVGSLIVDPWSGAMFELVTDRVLVDLDALIP